MLLDYIVACADCGHIGEEHEDHGADDAMCEQTGCDCAGYVMDEDDYQQIAVGDAESDLLTLAEAEAIIGEPAHEWASRCFEIASKLATAVGGVAVYGAWDGPVSPGTPFYGRPLVNHGWVLLDSGEVFDPTRWVFEGLRPYLYEGPEDYYDEGANRRRKSFGRPSVLHSACPHPVGPRHWRCAVWERRVQRRGPKRRWWRELRHSPLRPSR